MKYLAISAVLASALAFSASARQLTPEEALLRAALPAGPANTIQSVSAQPELVHTATDGDLNTVYAFNRPGGGFAIVSADDASAISLFGFSDSGSLPADTADMAPGLRWLLDSYSEAVKQNINGHIRPVDAIVRTDIAPLITTKWAQIAPYNALCPEVSGERSVTGCVATAMAQVMNYHKWPLRGTGTHQYTWHQQTLSMDFSQVEFQWDKMLPAFTEQSDSASKAAVAQLMYACGVAVNMNYSPTLSGGNYYSASEALIKYFGYDKGMRYISREYYDIESWIDLLYGELAAKRPVLYCGSSHRGGHAFIVDGYRTTDNVDYFHINWGWHGWSDGYFQITELEPTVQGTGGTSSGYNESQNMVIGIKPAVAGSEALPVMEFSSDFWFENATVDRTAADAQVVVKDPAYIFAQSLLPLHAAMGVKLTSADDGEVKYVASEQKHYIRGQAFNHYNLAAADFPTEGNWLVEPAVQDSLGNWYDDGLVRMNHIRYATLAATPDQLVFTKGEEAQVRCNDLSLMSPVYSGKQFGVKGTMTAYDGEYYREVYVVLYHNGIAVAQGPVVSVQLDEGMSETVEWVGTFNKTFSPGQYLIELVETGGDVVSNALPVTVEATPTEDTEYEIYYTYGDNDRQPATEQNPAQATIDPFVTTIHITCTSGYFSDILSGCIFRGTTGVYEIPGGFVGLKAGESAEIRLVLDKNYVSPDVVYNMKTLAEQKQQYIGTPSYFIVSTACVDEPTADSDRGEPTAYYTIDGIALTQAPQSGIYIAVYADGTALKIMR